MIEVINQQDSIKIDLTRFENWTKIAALAFSESSGKSLSVAFVSAKQITLLNNKFRNKNASTDVLSFPNKTDEFESDENYLGDIVISPEQAQKQAIENNLPLETEIKQLILHGVIHLCGYDHATDNGEMNELELKLRDKLEIN